MNEDVETFMLDGVRVSVEETHDALTYTFAPQRRNPTAPSLVSFVFVLVLAPLGYLALVVYARSRVEDRPEWEDFLTGVFMGQMLAWLVTGAARCYQILRRSYHPYGIVLQFTRTHLYHAGHHVCELEEARGLRLFVYTTTTRLLADIPLPRTAAPPNPNAPPLPPEFQPIPPEERPSKTEACLSLVIGADGGTHGLFGGFDVQPLRELAEHIHRRLAAFRRNQGEEAKLDALSVIETTEEDAANQSHTRPATGSYDGFSFAALLLLQNRWLGIAWSATMLAGLYATVRLIPASGLARPFIIPHCLLGLVHFFLLVVHINGPERPTKQPAAK